MKKLTLLSCLCIIYSCTMTETEIVPTSDYDGNSHSIECRSSIKIEELPDSYDFNVKLSDAELIANKYSSEKNLQELVPYEQDGHTLFYVANFDKGYKVISGDKRTPLFLLESDEGRFEFKEDGEFDGPSFWLNNLASELLLLKKGEAEVTDASNVLFWNSITGNNDLRIPNQLLLRDALDSIDFDDPEHIWALVTLSEHDYYYNDTIVPHILITKWGQNDPWNWDVPFKGAGYAPDEHCRTGCSAVAMAQIIYYCHYSLNKPHWLYHGAMATGTCNDPNDPISFTPGTYSPYSTHWDDMAVDTTGLRYNFEYDYVGQLMADIGNEIGMTYTPTKSSASVKTSGFNHYNISCSSGSYNSSTVISNLLLNKPVVVSAVAYDQNSVSHGHSWVIDGLDAMVTEHVITYEWRRLSELNSNNYPLYTEEQMMYIDPDVYSGKTFQESIRYNQYLYKMNWGHDGYGDNISYGIYDSDSWIHYNLNYNHNRKIWYDFR